MVVFTLNEAALKCLLNVSKDDETYVFIDYEQDESNGYGWSVNIQCRRGYFISFLNNSSITAYSSPCMENVQISIQSSVCRRQLLIIIVTSINRNKLMYNYLNRDSVQ